jgi:hypothetical protein
MKFMLAGSLRPARRSAANWSVRSPLAARAGKPFSTSRKTGTALSLPRGGLRNILSRYLGLDPGDLFPLQLFGPAWMEARSGRPSI